MRRKWTDDKIREILKATAGAPNVTKVLKQFGTSWPMLAKWRKKYPAGDVPGLMKRVSWVKTKAKPTATPAADLASMIKNLQTVIISQAQEIASLRGKPVAIYALPNGIHDKNGERLE